MDIREQLMELETTAQHISDGLAAIQVMVVGLDGLGSQYAGALNAVCSLSLIHISEPTRPY